MAIGQFLFGGALSGVVGGLMMKSAWPVSGFNGSHPLKVTSIKDGLGAQNQIREIREDVQSSTSCDDQRECKVLKEKRTLLEVQTS